MPLGPKRGVVSAMTQHPIIVVGAGIVGISTALWLQRDGHDVVLMDKDKPGQAASYGNSGLIANWAVTPVTYPGLWWALPRMVLDRRAPLFLKWRDMPKMAPWLAKFMGNATDRKTRQIANSMATLLTDAVDQHRALVKGTAVESWVHDSKINFLYPTRRAFDRDKYNYDLMADAGQHADVITGPAVHEEEPILGPRIQCIAQMSGTGHITDPGNYAAKLAEHFAAQGGRFVRATVQDFGFTGGHVSQVRTDQGAFDCAKAVVTSGIWSKELTRKLGLNIPVESERGYHVIYENPSELPRNPMLLSDGKFGVNAMDMGLRFAGTVELARHTSPQSQRPLDLIQGYVKATFPNLTCTGTQEWMGNRPTLPDSVPIIGPLKDTGIFAGFGHQHVGLTSGPKTGRLLAQMIGGAGPNIDMAPYSADRYLN